MLYVDRNCYLIYKVNSFSCFLLSASEIIFFSCLWPFILVFWLLPVVSLLPWLLPSKLQFLFFIPFFYNKYYAQFEVSEMLEFMEEKQILRTKYAWSWNESVSSVIKSRVWHAWNFITFQCILFLWKYIYLLFVVYFYS